MSRLGEKIAVLVGACLQSPFTALSTSWTKIQYVEERNFEVSRGLRSMRAEALKGERTSPLKHVTTFSWMVHALLRWSSPSKVFLSSKGKMR